MASRFRVRRFKRKVAAGVAAGAALAAADAQAVPIYMDVEDVTISPVSSNREILLNVSNLINRNANLSDNLPDASLAWVDPPDATPNPLTLMFTGLNNMAMALPNPLRPGDLVGINPPDDTPNPFVGSFNLATVNPPDTLGEVDPPDIRGPWVGLSNAFLGWQVDIPGESPHFGWLRVSLDTAGNFTLFDFAIESQSNTPIQAGQTAAVPEAGSLALLALGAAGLALWRRGRRSA